ncbi:ATP-binding cassette domain-containing protein [Pseudomonas sp. FSL L8-0168]|uniref:ATP-binding cassette domain-containing protein n=1 Tax=Pseudomonas sp. FSL L8-0168 TaxID=2921518 RepID=UPI0030DA2DE4
MSVDDIVRLMVGQDVEFVRKPLTGEPGEVMLSVQGVSRGSGEGGHNLNETVLRDMSIDVRAGEIVGFAGLVGAGRTELARVIFGADGCDEGIIYVNGRQASPFKSPRDGIAAGVALVPEDRKQQACFLRHSIRWNMTLPSLGRLQRWGMFIDDRAETQLIQDYQKRLRIKMANDSVAIGTLSGGNQQKVILARCMALKPKVLIVDEPTRGIDVGADTTAIGSDIAPPEIKKKIGNYKVLGKRAEQMIPNARLVVFPGRGHAPQMEDVADFNSTLVAELHKP